MSPASKGLLPGLVLGLLAAFAVLALNTGWLLPSVDHEGLTYLLAAPQLAAGEAPVLPAATWDDPQGTAGVQGGTAMPLFMGVVVGTGARPHVAALWALALGAGLVVLTAAWIGGGVAGLPGAVAAGLTVFVSPMVVEVVTSVRPEALVAGAVGLQLGIMTYRPRWSLLHGAAGAAAWLAHPVGLGAVAAALIWPLRGRRGAAAVGRSVAAAVPAFLLLGSGSLVHGLLVPAGLPGVEALTVVAGILGWMGGGLPGLVGGGAGVMMAAGLLALVVLDARATPDVPQDVHWSHPSAPDLLQSALRPAAGLLALSVAVAAVASGGHGGELARLWMPAVMPLAVLGSTSAVRRWQGRGGVRALLPGVGLALWLSVSALAAGWTFVDVRDQGRGLTRDAWVSSEVTRWLDNRSEPYAVLYASDPGLVLLQSGRLARALPPDPGASSAFHQAFRDAPGAVILTDGAAAQGEALARALGLDRVVDVEEGGVLVPRAPGL